MDLKSLAQLGRVEKEIEIQGFKFKLHTLSVSDQQGALLSIPDGVKDEAVRLLKLQEAILVFATDTINEESVDKKKLQEIYSSLQPKVLSYIFSKYSELTKDQDVVLGELKKN